jgi:hypothetical protein
VIRSSPDKKGCTHGAFSSDDVECRNLFGVGDADGPATEAALAAKIESLRAVIDAQRPHVLALQEIGREESLRRLQRALVVPMPYRQLGIADERGIRVAFISRRALHGRVDIRPFPPGFLPIQVGDDPAGPDGGISRARWCLGRQVTNAGRSP